MTSPLEQKEFMESRADVLATWPTGKAVNLEEAFRFHQALPNTKICANVLEKAEQEGKVLLQPRAGVALVDDHIKLLTYLQKEADLLPTTIDAYTRQKRYQEAETGIQRSIEAGRSLLNGFPAVNHGLAACRRIINEVDLPVEVRHGTPDARLLAEITLAAGFTSFEGGGISYNIPYAKSVRLEKSIRDWQYVDRLVGLYESQGCSINREPFGPLSGTLVPPSISHAVAIIEGLLALQQGVKSITLGYGQAGCLVQDIAAMQTLKELAHFYFNQAGYTDYSLSTVFHEWMGGFPEDEARAFAVIAWGGAVGALAGATKVIVKTPHEAMGIPTKEANLDGLKATSQVIRMLAEQKFEQNKALEIEKEIIKQEVHAILGSVFEAGKGDLVIGTVKAFEAGLIDVPFAPAQCNMGKLLPVRDNSGAVRIFDSGNVPFPRAVLDFHKEKLIERSKSEGREPCFQMVIDDIYAISKGRLVGRPS